MSGHRTTPPGRSYAAASTPLKDKSKVFVAKFRLACFGSTSRTTSRRRQQSMEIWPFRPVDTSAICGHREDATPATTETHQ